MDDVSELCADIGAALGRLAASGWLDKLDEFLDGVTEPQPLVSSPEGHYQRAKNAFDQVERIKTLSGMRTSELQREGIGEACLGILSALIHFGGAPSASAAKPNQG